MGATIRDVLLVTGAVWHDVRMQFRLIIG